MGNTHIDSHMLDALVTAPEAGKPNENLSKLLNAADVRKHATDRTPVAVTAVVMEHNRFLALNSMLDTKVLQVSRDIGNTEDWGLPGGKIEPGETPKQAIIREVMEETGISLDEDSVVQIMEHGGCVTFFALGDTRKARVTDAGEVRIAPWDDLITNSPFGSYNRKLYASLLVTHIVLASPHADVYETLGLLGEAADNFVRLRPRKA